MLSELNFIYIKLAQKASFDKFRFMSEDVDLTSKRNIGSAEINIITKNESFLKVFLLYGIIDSVL